MVVGRWAKKREGTLLFGCSVVAENAFAFTEEIITLVLYETRLDQDHLNNTEKKSNAKGNLFFLKSLLSIQALTFFICKLPIIHLFVEEKRKCLCILSLAFSIGT